MKIIKEADLGTSKLGWLDSKHHFSFSNYHNPQRMHFGVLRVINDDIISSGRGFGFHPHHDMEIVSYVIKGELSHEDSLGHKGVIKRGEVQYMSAGSGILHTEFNHSDSDLRLLQIWVLPDAKGYKPHYEEYKAPWEIRHGNWLHLVSSKAGEAPIKVNQDVNFYALELDENQEITVDVNSNRRAYIIQIEGSSVVNNETIVASEAIELKEESVTIATKEKSHYLMIEMKK